MLLPWLSAFDNVALAFQLAGGGAAQAGAGPAGLVGLAGFERARPRQLSGGCSRVSRSRERWRSIRTAAAGRAVRLARRGHAPPLNLELQRIWWQRRIPTLLVTHSVDEAVFLADRVVVLSGRPGRIHEVVDVPLGRPRDAEVMRSPAFHALTDQLALALDSAD